MDERIAFHVPRFLVRRLARPELRKDPIVERWVIISTERLGRPQELSCAPPIRLLVCPFCAGNERLTPEAVIAVPAGDGWQIRIVPNTFPALQGDEMVILSPSGLFDIMAAVGVHEVVVECREHETNLAHCSAEHIADLCRALAERVRLLGADRPDLYPLIFKNHGASAGASLEHAHSQFMGLPMTPILVQQELDAARAYDGAEGHCIFCDLVERERSLGERLVLETPRFVVLAPFASRFPCELWIVPRTHRSHFERATDSEVAEFGHVYHRVLRLLDAGLDDPPYNSVVHTAPLDQPDVRYYHWHMEVLPRLTGIAGFECGTGMNINPVPPEQAAAYLRGVAAKIH